MSLEGKIALITGGTGELGTVIAGRLAREGAGVYISARGPVPAGTYTGRSARRIRVLRADLTSEASVSRLFRTVAKKSGKADVLVNCVGAFALTGPFAGTRTEDWDRMIDVNLRSVFLSCRAFLRQKALGGYGRIINFAAQTVFRKSRDRAAYAVAKGAVATLTELIGEELRGSGITANAIAPSIIRSPSNIKAMPEADASAWVDPEAIAGEIVHLCDPSSAAINGAVIPIFAGVKA